MFRYIRQSFAVQGHSAASLAIFLSIMGETGNHLPPLTVNLEQSSQESAFSGEETLNLVSRLLDSKLDKKFSEFQRGLELNELATDSQIKKLKTEARASNSFQFKGNKLQFEFNSSLLDSINTASASLLEGNLARVNQELENAKTLLSKRNKAIRFADKSPAGWTAVEEYESDELADDSEDEKKLRSAERRALSKLRAGKQIVVLLRSAPSSLKSHFMLPGVIVLLVSLFVLSNFLSSPFEVISHFEAENHSLLINASPVNLKWVRLSSVLFLRWLLIPCQFQFNPVGRKGLS